MDKIDSEGQMLLKEAQTTVSICLDKLDLDELMDFSLYLKKISDDYKEQETKIRDARLENIKEVVFPKYRKLNLSELEEKPWWPKVQVLFTEEGGKEMPSLVFMFSEKYIQKKARENPL